MRLFLKNLTTGNSELILDRKVADKNISCSRYYKIGNEKKELLFEKDELSKMNVLRRIKVQWEQWME